MKFRFPIYIIDKDFRSENTLGSGVRALADAIESEGFEVVGTTQYGGFSQLAQQQSRASAFIVSLDDADFEDRSGPGDVILELRDFITRVRRKNADVPIYIYGETKTSQDLPNDILRELHGFIHRFEDTPDFVARHIIREARDYLEGLKPPFFKALLNYAESGSYSWHCPGHSGGVAFLKSPVGQLYHQFYGENMLRADVCSSVQGAGQLLEHTGAAGQSERNAARIFNADHCFFVTNGTSTANKTVWHYVVAPGDVVIVDRNCHKSVLHAIIMTGAIPVFLRPRRNPYGIIGPIPRREFTPEGIRERMAASPLLAGRDVDALQPRVLSLTQSTYDGVMYDTEQIKQQLDGYIPNLHFDEAWIPHAAFHPFYSLYHAMGRRRERPQQALVYVTQSIHKLLAGISQASQILVQDSQQLKLDRYRFNEAYLMHVSTSPQYSIIASCDVAAAMMDRPAGPVMVEECLLEAIEFRRAMRKVAAEYGQQDWWFEVWGPRDIGRQGLGESGHWKLQASGNGQAAWHGFGDVAEGFTMLDPIKATILTPGLDLSGEFADWGIPATIINKYLGEHGIVVEKIGFYNFLVMFTLGITKGRWDTLVTELQQFKDAYDGNAPLWRVMPEFARQYPQYEHMGLKELCQHVHELYRQHDIVRVVSEIYVADLEPAMLPADAYACIPQGRVERVAVDELEGRIATGLITPYPPGIPLVIPGERFTREIVDYLKFARDFARLCPGFENDIHGLVAERATDGSVRYFADCVDADS